MKILIAYDGSSCADAALDDLRQAGLPSEATAAILSVADVWVAPSPDEELLPQTAGTAMEQRIIAARRQAHEKAMQAVEEARTLAVRAREQVQTDFPSWRVSVEACADSPAWGILKKAKEWKPDLIVVGSHGRSALDRIVLGSVSQKVVTEARCPVRVSRGREKQANAAVRIVIGVDGSPGADAAVCAVAQRSWPPHTTAYVVAVVDSVLTSATLWRTGHSDTPNVQERVQTLLEAAVEQLRAAGLTASPYMLTGNPKQALIEAAERWDADCVFVGARGLRGMGGFLLGSVSTAVSTRAPCSVEVVHTDSEHA